MDVPPDRFSERVRLPCPYKGCKRWLSSWVMLGIHVSGHVKADELLEREKRLREWRKLKRKKPARTR